LIHNQVRNIRRSRRLSIFTHSDDQLPNDNYLDALHFIPSLGSDQKKIISDVSSKNKNGICVVIVDKVHSLYIIERELSS
jgi:hypothetical protein